MKFAFVTCVQLGQSCIEKIYEIGGNLDLLITLKDEKAKNKSGRIYLDEFAEKQDVPLLKINHINDEEAINALIKYDIDWMFIIGWSQIAGEKVINTPKYGSIGMHPTLLPKGRGRAAIPWAIIKGLTKTGVTMFKLDEGVDTGPILGQIEIPMEEDENASTLYKKVNIAHESLIEQIWPSLKDGSLKATVQDDSQATYWEGRKPEDGEIKQTMSVVEVDRLVRAVTTPYPGAFIDTEGKKTIIWEGHPVDNEISASRNQVLLKLKDGNYLGTRIEEGS